MERLKLTRLFLKILFLALIFIYPIFSTPELSLRAEERSSAKKELTIFYAAGLNASMDGIIKEFKKLHPLTKIIAESSASLLAIRKVTELNRKADVILLADAIITQNMLIPKYTDWYIGFYKDSIVIAYTDRSKYTNEINRHNWYEVLLRKDVRYGYANPNLAPIGYRTLMCWQLADLYYQNKIDNKGIYQRLKEACPKGHIMPDVAELLHLLESLYLDYAFVYASTAKQHNLKYIQLPEEIDLSNPELGEVYKQAKVEITPKLRDSKETVMGGPITFVLTILKESSNFEEAVEFVKLLLAAQGRQILEHNNQAPMHPYLAYNPDMLPRGLKEFVSEAALHQ